MDKETVMPFGSRMETLREGWYRIRGCARTGTDREGIGTMPTEGYVRGYVAACIDMTAIIENLEGDMRAHHRKWNGRSLSLLMETMARSCGELRVNPDLFVRRSADGFELFDSRKEEVHHVLGK